MIDLFPNGEITMTDCHKGKPKKKGKKKFSKYSKVFFKYSKVNIILRHLLINYFPADIMNQYRRYTPHKKFYNSHFSHSCTVGSHV